MMRYLFKKLTTQSTLPDRIMGGTCLSDEETGIDWARRARKVVNTSPTATASVGNVHADVSESWARYPTHGSILESLVPWEKNWLKVLTKELESLIVGVGAQGGNNSHPAPNHAAIYWAKRVLAALHEENLEPSGLRPSAEGGVTIFFSQGDYYADLECFNTGEILGVTSDRRSTPVVWELSEDLPRSLERIREFFRSCPAGADVSSKPRS